VVPDRYPIDIHKSKQRKTKETCGDVLEKVVDRGFRGMTLKASIANAFRGVEQIKPFCQMT